MKIKLQKISTTKTQSAFMLSFGDDNATVTTKKLRKVFLTNTEESDKFWLSEAKKPHVGKVKETCKYNKNSLYDDSTNTVYYPMYNSIQPYYKSAIYKRGKSFRDGTTYDFQDITNHKLSSELLDICHVGNIMYAAEPKNQYGRYDLTCDVWSWLSVNHGYATLPLKKIDTVLYDVEALKQVLQSSNNLTAYADQLVKETCNNVQYNMLYEINGNIYNDYEGGSIAANTFKAKNQYNCTYDMEHASNKKFRNTRDYVGIDTCNKTLYLKYYDNVYYANKTSDPSTESSNKFGFKYPNIEVMKAVNRYESFNAHKTNLYSIVVTTDILKKTREYIVENFGGESAMSEVQYQALEKILNNICLEVSNGVKSIAESLQPAHAQLYSIYVK